MCLHYVYNGTVFVCKTLSVCICIGINNTCIFIAYKVNRYDDGVCCVFTFGTQCYLCNYYYYSMANDNDFFFFFGKVVDHFMTTAVTVFCAFLWLECMVLTYYYYYYWKSL